MRIAVCRKLISRSRRIASHAIARLRHHIDQPPQGACVELRLCEQVSRPTAAKGARPHMPYAKLCRHLCEPSISLRKPSVSLRKLCVSLHKPSVSLRNPSVSLRKPSVSLLKPSVSLRKPSVSLRRPTISLCKPSTLNRFLNC